MPETKSWKLILHGNETYPFPLSIETEDGKEWVARDGTVSKLEHARLIAAAPTMYEALKLCRSWVGAGAGQASPEGCESANAAQAALTKALTAAEGKAKVVSEADHYRELLLEAHEWFEEHIGHDGAPDGGDPAWVSATTQAIGGERSKYGPDWDAILTIEMRRRAAGPVMHGALQMVCDSGVALAEPIESAMTAALAAAEGKVKP